MKMYQSGNKHVPGRCIISAAVLWLMLLAFALLASGCSSRSQKSEAETETADYVTVGFSQLGAESDWRSANSQSMRQAFTTESGYRLLFKDGQQKQSKQITAIRSFIQQGVDYIVLAPVTQLGWDSVLSEAKDAGIPVIIVDRMVETSDESLYTCWVGSDFLKEGRKAAQWIHEYAAANQIADEEIHIVNIQGTPGSSAQLGRTQGLEEAAEAYGWNLLEETTGEFTQAKGREVMSQMLEQYHDLNVVYCENDNMALGAIEAIEAAGKKAGSNIADGEIMVISFDGVSDEAMNLCLQGTISLIVECNPLHGPRVESIIKELEEGQTPDKKEYVFENMYSSRKDVAFVTVEGEEYQVTYLNREVLDSRSY